MNPWILTYIASSKPGSFTLPIVDFTQPEIKTENTPEAGPAPQENHFDQATSSERFGSPSDVFQNGYVPFTRTTMTDDYWSKVLSTDSFNDGDVFSDRDMIAQGVADDNSSSSPPYTSEDAHHTSTSGNDSSPSPETERGSEEYISPSPYFPLDRSARPPPLPRNPPNSPVPPASHGRVLPAPAAGQPPRRGRGRPLGGTLTVEEQVRRTIGNQVEAARESSLRAQAADALSNRVPANSIQSPIRPTVDAAPQSGRVFNRPPPVRQPALSPLSSHPNPDTTIESSIERDEMDASFSDFLEAPSSPSSLFVELFGSDYYSTPPQPSSSSTMPSQNSSFSLPAAPATNQTAAVVSAAAPAAAAPAQVPLQVRGSAGYRHALQRIARRAVASRVHAMTPAEREQFTEEQVREATDKFSRVREANNKSAKRARFKKMATTVALADETLRLNGEVARLRAIIARHRLGGGAISSLPHGGLNLGMGSLLGPLNYAGDLGLGLGNTMPNPYALSGLSSLLSLPTDNNTDDTVVPPCPTDHLVVDRGLVQDARDCRKQLIDALLTDKIRPLEFGCHEEVEAVIMRGREIRRLLGVADEQWDRWVPPVEGAPSTNGGRRKREREDDGGEDGSDDEYVEGGKKGKGKGKGKKRARKA